MIFKRFFTWFTWSLRNAPSGKTWISYTLLLGPMFAILFLDLWVSNPLPWYCAEAGYYGFLMIGTLLYTSPKRNWRIAIDKAEKKAKEIGRISDKFQDVFTKIKDQVRKSQNPDKLIEFIYLLTELKAEDTMMAIGSEIRIREIRQRIFKLAKED